MTGTAALLILQVLGADPFLEEGKRLYDAMLYEKAAAKLKAAAESPTSTREERREAVDLLARALFAQGRTEEAEREYARLLGRDPNATGPTEASPKIRAAFQRAKSRLYPEGFVALNPIAATPAGVEIDVLDPYGLVRSLTLSLAQGSDPFTTRPMQYDGSRASSRFGELADGPVRYFVLALDSEQGQVAELGNEKAPLLLRPLAVELPSPALVETPALVPPKSLAPVWVVGSLAIACAVAGTALALAAQSDANAAQRTLFASDAKGLNDSARAKAISGDVAFGAAILSFAGAGILAWTRF